jgi:hypothetical protein
MANKTYQNEKWEPVYFKGIDPEEKYEVSNYGRIRRHIRKVNDWKIQKPANVNGYAYFSFRTIEDSNGKNRITKSIHRIVAEVFIGPSKEDCNNVIHVDFDKWNNNVDNLKWVAKKDMFIHSRKSPRTAIAIEKRKGEITNSKLTATDVMRLKKKLKRGKNPLYKIAREFGITHTQLNRIRRGENWSHIKID